eukprot:TRINITY_DN14923_c0_g1_i2.p1 TRINITY_DN14923_c0_g1~~TRINITY_DN14923_c0_g1_i2.p1  ORF type:complete len:216 (+),score=47.92 TRINITY_DN14923_c0_g1_i2:79-726(+)
MCIRDRYNKLTAVGFQVFAFDYRGFGDSPGWPDEAGVTADARSFWRHLAEEQGCLAEDVIIWGHSLGSAVALALVQGLVEAGEAMPGSVVLEAPLSSVLDVVLSKLPGWASTLCEAPLDRILKHKWASFDRVHRVASRCPVTILHGTEDDVVPFAQGVRLHCEACKGGQEAEFRGFVGASHDSIVEHPKFESVLTSLTTRFALSLIHISEPTRPY